MAQENRIVQLERCDCKISCITENGETKEDGDIWDENCNTCQCKKGEKSCLKTVCNETKCKNPVLINGDCCPHCLSKFLYK